MKNLINFGQNMADSFAQGICPILQAEEFIQLQFADDLNWDNCQSVYKYLSYEHYPVRSVLTRFGKEIRIRAFNWAYANCL